MVFKFILCQIVCAEMPPSVDTPELVTEPYKITASFPATNTSFDDYNVTLTTSQGAPVNQVSEASKGSYLNKSLS